MTDMPIVVVVGSLHYDIMVDAPHLPRKGETVTGYSWRPKFGGKGGNQAVETCSSARWQQDWRPVFPSLPLSALQTMPQHVTCRRCRRVPNRAGAAKHCELSPSIRRQRASIPCRSASTNRWNVGLRGAVDWNEDTMDQATAELASEATGQQPFAVTLRMAHRLRR